MTEFDLGTGHLNDDELLAAFERSELPNAQFHHADHLRVCWIYLRRLGEEAAAEVVIPGIRRLAARHGASRKFHFTISRAWIRLLAEAGRHLRGSADFASMVAANAHLLDKNLLSRHYSKAALEGEAARTGWMAPDLLPLPCAQKPWA